MNDFQSIQTTTGSTLSQIAPAARASFVARDSMATSHSSHGWASPDTHETTCRPDFETKAFMTPGTVWAADATTLRVRTRKSSNKTSEGDSKILDAIHTIHTIHTTQDTEIRVTRT